MYSEKSYKLTKGEFDYLLPVLRSKLLQREDNFCIIADHTDDLEDILNRLKGFYDNYVELKNMIIYKCFTHGSLNHFRELVLNKK